jgi:hypothetical protein
VRTNALARAVHPSAFSLILSSFAFFAPLREICFAQRRKERKENKETAGFGPVLLPLYHFFLVPW